MLRQGEVQGEVLGEFVALDAPGAQVDADRVAHLIELTDLLAGIAQEFCEEADAMRNRIRELGALFRLNSLLVRSADSLDRLLESALELAIGALELHAGSIVLFPEDADGVLSAAGLKMVFEDGFFHADPHPGNIMLVGDELKPGLIDFGQCTTLTKPQLRTVCQLVVLLRTRSQTLIDQALRGSGFGFNTEDPELKLALSYLRVLKC